MLYFLRSSHPFEGTSLDFDETIKNAAEVALSSSNFMVSSDSAHGTMRQ